MAPRAGRTVMFPGVGMHLGGNVHGQGFSVLSAVPVVRKQVVPLT